MSLTHTVEDLLPTLVLLTHVVGFLAGVLTGFLLSKVVPALYRKMKRWIGAHE